MKREAPVGINDNNYEVGQSCENNDNNLSSPTKKSLLKHQRDTDDDKNDIIIEEIEEEESEDINSDIDIENQKVPALETDVKEVWNPWKNKLGNDEELVVDPTAYDLFYEFTTTWPCLTIDIIKDSNLPLNYEITYPKHVTMIGGTQADEYGSNALYVMHFSNLTRTTFDELLDEEPIPEHLQHLSAEYESSKQQKATDPKFTIRQVPYPWGSINKLCVHPELQRLVATYGEDCVVRLWDISSLIAAVNGDSELERNSNSSPLMKPRFELTSKLGGHQSEGFALAWSPVDDTSAVNSFKLASGDQSGLTLVTHVGKEFACTSTPYPGHTASVEAVSWKQCGDGKGTIFATASADGDIKIWDITKDPNNACIATIKDAHGGQDVNVIAFNPHEDVGHQLVSGGEDGSVIVWDTRTIVKNQELSKLAILSCHTDAVSSVAWDPFNESQLLSASYDDTICVWDLALERAEDDIDLDIPQELAFVHMGQKDVADAKWHPQLQGCIISSSIENINITKPQNI